MKPITDRIVMIHHDADGVLRDFHGYAMDLFYKKYPEYKKYQVPTNEIRGWQFEDEFWPLDKAKEVDQLMMEMFFGGDFTYKVFREAPALVSPKQWADHVVAIKESLPNSRIVISTHQYTYEAKLATIEWLEEHGIEHEDLIFTGEKDRFAADYLLDDKPQTIVNFSTNGSVGVLMKRNRGNAWFLRDNPGVITNMVDTLEDFTKFILSREKVVRKYKSIEYSLG